MLVTGLLAAPLLAVLMWVASPSLTSWLGDETLAQTWPWVAAGVPILTMWGVSAEALRGLSRMKSHALLQPGIVAAGAVVCMVGLGWNIVSSYAASLVASALLGAVLLVTALPMRTKAPAALSSEWGWKPMLQTGWPMLLGSAMFLVMSWTDVAFGPLLGRGSGGHLPRGVPHGGLGDVGAGGRQQLRCAAFCGTSRVGRPGRPESCPSPNHAAERGVQRTGAWGVGCGAGVVDGVVWRSVRGRGDVLGMAGHGPGCQCPVRPRDVFAQHDRARATRPTHRVDRGARQLGHECVGDSAIWDRGRRRGDRLQHGPVECGRRGGRETVAGIVGLGCVPNLKTRFGMSTPRQDALNRVNFFVIGAAKCGTTTLYARLSQHPEVFLSPLKEPNYYSRSDLNPARFSKAFKANTKLDLTDYLAQSDPLPEMQVGFVRDEGQYARLFSGATDAHRVVGECSTSYLWSPSAPAALHAAHPDAKIVVALRDPVERIYSHYLMARKYGFVKGSVVEAVKADLAHPDPSWGRSELFVELSLYEAQIKGWQAYFPEAKC